MSGYIYCYNVYIQFIKNSEAKKLGKLNLFTAKDQI